MTRAESAISELVCTDPDSFRIARRVGSDRIEVCAALEVGGVSPSAGLLEEAVAASADGGPRVVALVRPRTGDFVVRDEAELRVLRREVASARALGAEGVALGLLDARGGVDAARTAELVAAAGPLRVTFHRAFDHVAEPFAALERLIELGVARVLTSGGAPTAWEGRAQLRALQERFGAAIEIVAAAGVTGANALDLLEATGVAAIHGSCGKPAESPSHRVPLGAHEPPRRTLDERCAEAFVAAARAFPPRNSRPEA